MEQRISIPKVFASADLEKLLTLFQPVLADRPPATIVLDFSQCKFLAHHGVAVIGAIAHYLKTQDSVLTLDMATLKPDIHQNLAQNGLLHYLGHEQTPWDGNSIHFRHDQQFDQAAIVTYLTESWLGRGWLNISLNCRDLIVGKVLEIYLNAFEHSQSHLGVFSCGQHYPQRKRLKLTILDLGVGIPSNVRNFRQNQELTGEAAIKWAFQKGTSTRPLAETARGVGLDLIREFIRLNGGKLQIDSHDGYAKVAVNKEQYGVRNTPFQGTIVNIDLICDESYYCLQSEVNSIQAPLF